MIKERKRDLENSALLKSDSFSESRRPGTVIGSTSECRRHRRRIRASHSAEIALALHTASSHRHFFFSFFFFFFLVGSGANR
jgi:hypothetical protein